MPREEYKKHGRHKKPPGREGPAPSSLHRATTTTRSWIIYASLASLHAYVHGAVACSDASLKLETTLPNRMYPYVYGVVVEPRCMGIETQTDRHTGAARATGRRKPQTIDRAVHCGG